MKKEGLLMIIGAAALLTLFFFPLWHIQLIAPQYPEGLGMYIYINNIEGATEFDIQNIDGLNHYIGMKTIPKPDEMWEFSVFPKVVIGLVALGVIIGILGFLGILPPIAYLIWFILAAVLGLLGIYDFNLWLVDYGGNLDPNASIKLLDPNGNPMVYKPPLLGHKKLLNFDVDSWPALGGWMMGLSFALVLLSYWLGIRSRKKTNT